MAKTTQTTPHVTGVLQHHFFSKKGIMPIAFDEILNAFNLAYERIDSAKFRFCSNKVLYEIGQNLKKSQFFDCEQITITSSGNYTAAKGGKINMHINLSGSIKKTFNPDIKSKDDKIIVEVEAGQAVDNFRFLKDLFESIVYTNCDYLGIAVRNVYSTYDKNGKPKSTQYDYDTVCEFLSCFFCSRADNLPLKGVLVIGY